MRTSSIPSQIGMFFYLLAIWFCMSVSGQAQIPQKSYVKEVVNDKAFDSYIVVMRCSYQSKPGYLIEEINTIRQILKKETNISKVEIKNDILKGSQVVVDSTWYKNLEHGIIFDNELITFNETPQKIVETYFSPDRYQKICGDRVLTLSICVFLFNNNHFLTIDEETGVLFYGKHLTKKEQRDLENKYLQDYK